MALEQLPYMIEHGFRLFERYSIRVIDTGAPKPRGLGMVSGSRLLRITCKHEKELSFPRCGPFPPETFR